MHIVVLHNDTSRDLAIYFPHLPSSEISAILATRAGHTASFSRKIGIDNGMRVTAVLKIKSQYPIGIIIVRVGKTMLRI